MPRHDSHPQPASRSIVWNAVPDVALLRQERRGCGRDGAPVGAVKFLRVGSDDRNSPLGRGDSPELTFAPGVHGGFWGRKGEVS